MFSHKKLEVQNKEEENRNREFVCLFVCLLVCLFVLIWSRGTYSKELFCPRFWIVFCFPIRFLEIFYHSFLFIYCWFVYLFVGLFIYVCKCLINKTIFASHWKLCKFVWEFTKQWKLRTLWWWTNYYFFQQVIL